MKRIPYSVTIVQNGALYQMQQQALKGASRRATEWLEPWDSYVAKRVPEMAPGEARTGAFYCLKA